MTEEGNAKRESALRARALRIHPACWLVPVSVAVDARLPEASEVMARGSMQMQRDSAVQCSSDAQA